MSTAPASCSSTQYAWAAGFLDGEGCFGAYKTVAKRYAGGKRWSVVITAVQREPAALLLLEAMFGGRVRPRTAVEGRRDQSVWTMTGATQIVSAIDALLPYLVTRRAQAEVLRVIAVRIAEHQSGQRVPPEEHAHRQALADALAALK